MSTAIHFGISTCPNDTFLFHGLLRQRVPTRGLDLRIDLMDVQELNRRLQVGEFDAAKASFFAAVQMAGDLGVLPVGSALGYGVGPLLLAAPGDSSADDAGPSARVLCPGEATTATLLYRLFHDGKGVIEQTVFDRIMPALREGRADLGVCIHEGRFTYQREGLRLVEDLGERWEREVGGPLPLGGLLARRSLPAGVRATLVGVLRESLDYAYAHRDEVLATMREHAQELDDDVIWAHVDLYVNRWTRDLGDVGRAALAELSARAAAAGLAGSGEPLVVFGDDGEER